jgi:hypothetical protein
MTDPGELERALAPAVLPTVVTVTQSFASRMPTQRAIDAIAAVEHEPFGDLVQRQAMRVVAFRALLRDWPDYDLAALWMHSYDVEVEIDTVDPTSPNGQTPEPSSVASTGSGPTT